MLVLDRKVGESIILGDNIEVVVVEVRDGRVKLGFEADRSVTILRKEIYDEVKRENEIALNKKTGLEGLKNLIRK